MNKTIKMMMVAGALFFAACSDNNSVAVADPLSQIPLSSSEDLESQNIEEPKFNNDISSSSVNDVLDTLINISSSSIIDDSSVVSDSSISNCAINPFDFVGDSLKEALQQSNPVDDFEETCTDGEYGRLDADCGYVQLFQCSNSHWYQIFPTNELPKKDTTIKFKACGIAETQPDELSPIDTARFDLYQSISNTFVMKNEAWDMEETCNDGDFNQLDADCGFSQYSYCVNGKWETFNSMEIARFQTFKNEYEQCGGCYSEFRSIDEKAQTALEEAIKGTEYETASCYSVSSQVVAGVNYKFLCHIEKDGYGDSVELVIFKPLNDEPAQITSAKEMGE